MFIEIRAAEGGEDSKLFVKDLAKAYIKLGTKLGWLIEYEHNSPGITILRCTSKGNKEKEIECNLLKEAGGHRIQRIPPTERKGRVHTSTVTVAISKSFQDSEEYSSLCGFTDKEITVCWFSGTGAGGQHRNKTQNSCRITHKETGIVVTAQTRSRENSLAQALSELRKRLKKLREDSSSSKENEIRRSQVGSGQRGDKIRTIQFNHDVAVDHRTGKRITAKQYMRGEMNLLW